MVQADKKTVLVAGGGFAGLATARALAKEKEFAVIVIDPKRSGRAHGASSFDGRRRSTAATAAVAATATAAAACLATPPSPSCRRSFFEFVPGSPASFVDASSAAKSLGDYSTTAGVTHQQGILTAVATDGTRGTATLQAREHMRGVREPLVPRSAAPPVYAALASCPAWQSVSLPLPLPATCAMTSAPWRHAGRGAAGL